MDENVAQDNLNTIKEMILDEQRLVTYISISKDLCIHVNNSKRLLQQIVEDIKENHPDTQLNVCYILSGISEDHKARTTVCSEADVEKTKASFKTLFFIHIHSVSKGSPSVDNVALLAVNKLEDLTLCAGLLKNHLCVKRSPEEIGKLKSTSQESVQKDQKVAVPPKKTKEAPKPDVRNGNDSKPVAKLLESKSEPSVKNEKISPKEEPPSSMKTVDGKKNGPKTQKGIAGFFSKSNSDPGKKSSKEEITVKSEKKDVPENDKVKEISEKDKIKEISKKDKVNSKSLDNNKYKNTNQTNQKTNKLEKMDVDEDIEVEKVEVKKENGTKPKNKSVTQIKKNAKVDKKRKRVLQVSDSESDEDKDPFLDDTPTPELDKHDSEDEIPPTPASNIVKITSGIVNPRKRRKIVDKTYTDEDGYILTKKEEVYESCSDNDEAETKENVKTKKIEIKTEVKMEDSPKSKKNGPKAAKKKISPPQKGKQATMMSFFKKI